MDKERKSKKNRRKKNKQNKTAESSSVSAGESVASDQNLVNGSEQIHQSQLSESSDAKEDFQKVDVESRKYHINNNEALHVPEAEKLHWLEREASLKQKIKQLQMEKDVHIQKEAHLETKIFELQGEKDSWLQKEAVYEERINQLIDGTATMGLRGVGLEEKISLIEKKRDSWVQKESATKEMIARINSDNTRLQEQVLELEDLKDKLLQENQHLTEKITSLQSQIQNLERNTTASAHSSTASITHVAEHEEMKSELETARALVEKLLSENSELVEKVNELYVEVNQRAATSEQSSSFGSNLMVGAPLEFNLMSVTTGKTYASVHTPVPMSKTDEILVSSGDGLLGSPVNVTLNYGRDINNFRNNEIMPYAPETIKSEGTVQISHHENDANRYGDSESAHIEEKIKVPISDAPLIGAPFRLISFVARYVSGADLVNKASVNTSSR